RAGLPGRALGARGGALRADRAARAARGLHDRAVVSEGRRGSADQRRACGLVALGQWRVARRAARLWAADRVLHGSLAQRRARSTARRHHSPLRAARRTLPGGVALLAPPPLRPALLHRGPARRRGRRASRDRAGAAYVARGSLVSPA